MAGQRGSEGERVGMMEHQGSMKMLKEACEKCTRSNYLSFPKSKMEV